MKQFSRLPSLLWPGLVLAAIALATIIFGLLQTVTLNLKVAPHLKEGAKNRLHYQMKNTTRFSGSPEEVATQVQQAVFLTESPQPWVTSGADWRTAISSAVAPSDSPPCIVVLAANGPNALAWALPGAYWALFAGCPVAFVERTSIPDDATALLHRYPDAPVYVFAPEALVEDQVLSQLATERRATRVAAGNLAAHAVKVAEYRDLDADVGWGRTYDRRNGYFEYVVAAGSEAEQALAALPLALSNAAALLYVNDDGSIPGVTDRYLWKQRADWWVTPAEGPFRHLWVVGNQVTYASQARLDHSLEKGPYAARGPTALGPIEAIVIVLIALGFAGMIFVFAHAARLLPEVAPHVKISWAATALLVPILGVLLYFAAYRRLPIDPDSTPAHFNRPPAIRAAAATAMSFGYGAPVMIAIGYAFVFFGFPLFFGQWAAQGWTYLFGAGMVLMMLAMWAGAILLVWLAVQVPMHKMTMPGMANRKLFGKSLLVTVLSMTAVSLGMMTMAWWMQMGYLRMMPHEDEVLWFGSMWLASMLGFLVAWPLNYPMVRTELKMGGL